MASRTSRIVLPPATVTGTSRSPHKRGLQNVGEPSYVGAPGLFFSRVYLVPRLLVHETAYGFRRFESEDGPCWYPKGFPHGKKGVFQSIDAIFDIIA